MAPENTRESVNSKVHLDGELANISRMNQSILNEASVCISATLGFGLTTTTTTTKNTVASMNPSDSTEKIAILAELERK